LVVAFLGTVPGSAAACSCAFGSQQRDLQRADAVFTGRVVRVEDERGNQEGLVSAEQVIATVAVDEVAKGRGLGGPFLAGLCNSSKQLRDDVRKPEPVPRARRVRVSTAGSEAACGLGLQRGQTWRIYAQRARPGEVPAVAEPSGDLAGDGPLSPVAFALGVAGLAAAIVGFAAWRTRRPA
jgi:hypothetical protein